jgi:CBS domain-containing protein
MTATTRPDPAPGGSETFETATVGDAMSPGVLSCAPHVPAPVVARMMATHGIHAVVVTAIPDAGARDEPLLCGIISDLDLLRAAQPRMEPLTARELAVTEALTVAPECPLPVAVGLMDDHRVRHLVVADRRRPVGVLSALDVAGVLAWGVG